MNNPILKFTTPLPPSVNDYLGHRVVFKFGKPIPQPYKKPKAVAYMNLVKTTVNRIIKESLWQLPSENEYVVCKIVAYKDKKNRDLDNMFKCLLDGIKETDVVYDDCMIIPRVENTFIDKDNPRLEVEVFVSLKMGVFKTDIHKAVFENINCNDCKKSEYSRRCGVMTKCLENRIIPEVDAENNVCLMKVEKCQKD